MIYSFWKVFFINDVWIPQKCSQSARYHALGCHSNCCGVRKVEDGEIGNVQDDMMADMVKRKHSESIQKVKNRISMPRQSCVQGTQTKCTLSTELEGKIFSKWLKSQCNVKWLLQRKLIVVHSVKYGWMFKFYVPDDNFLGWHYPAALSMEILLLGEGHPWNECVWVFL